MSQTSTADVDLVGEEIAVSIAQSAVFAALIGALAYASIPYPLSPAPVTLQVLGVFLAGLLLGPTWGAASMVLYLVAGALGAPVFAQGTAGLGELLGATGGYLFSYPIAAAAVGYIAHGGLEFRSLAESSVPRMVAGMAAGTLVIYGIGVPFMWWNLDMTVQTAIISGAVVFVPAEAAKMAAAIGLVRSNAIRAE
jgi:biotin transport system substrate-specific component